MRLLLITLVLLIAITAAATAVTITVDDEVLNTSPQSEIRSGRVYMPITSMKKLGLWVDYDAGDRFGRVGWPESDGIVNFDVGRVWLDAYGDAPEKTLKGKPFMKQRVLMIPLNSFTGSTFLAKWDNRSKTVSISRDKRWMAWRRRLDDELQKAQPDKYATPI
jgi:hypothetical protein